MSDALTVLFFGLAAVGAASFLGMVVSGLICVARGEMELSVD
jgi:hypothetical protein